ncbi:copper chaperone PCu(A)C [Oceanomicrobium pacificus]|uniref:Copper chaperone PCu(A)C n=1 Tax=Oceanomicrobium pacificus TaxID=2692916 RepID=A0A6B0TZ73_9RHOB|nr:copper chaperone PCu(A)C [Oceanomicrobium pacificus]MXU66572.1 copper chaperone PCu(A)C [Oceanomicrobium pacificus]
MKRTSLAATAALFLSALPLAAADLMIHDAYARVASPVAKAGAAFFEIRNPGDTADRLIDARSDVAKKTELHTHVMQDGVARMVQLEDGIEIPAGGAVLLQRGGNHVMFMGLTKPLPDGETVTVTLVFEKAGELTVEIPVDSARSADAAGHGHGGHTGH